VFILTQGAVQVPGSPFAADLGPFGITTTPGESAEFVDLSVRKTVRIHLEKIRRAVEIAHGLDATAMDVEGWDQKLIRGTTPHKKTFYRI
jgi:hypothetical protein